MRFRLLRVALLVVCAIVFSGCADTSNNSSDPNRVSTIPWNRPEKWEGQGGVGGFANSP